MIEAAGLAARPPSAIPVVSDGPVVAATFGWSPSPRKHLLVVVAKVTLRIVPNGAAEPLEEPPPLLGDVPFTVGGVGLRYASDFAPIKPRVDVTCVGHVHAGRGGVTHAQLVIGSVRRSVAAVGDRSWRGGVPTEPARFSTLPMRWELAFGGAGFPDNPIGRGLDGDALPNLEDPAALIGARGDRPRPICFAPVPRTFPTRSALLGTYDRRWLEEQWPCFAADLDPGYFQAAPPEQQLDGLRGDERFDLAGLRPQRDVLSGRLAGLGLRAFAQLTPSAGSAFEPLDLRLDTVAFDTDALEVALVWRGRRAVSAATAPEVAEIFVAAHPLAQPISPVAARERYLALVSPPADVAAAPPEAIRPPRPTMTRDDALAAIAAAQPLSGWDFSGCDLTDVDLTGRDLVDARFADATLTGARFDRADLTGAWLARARAAGASFAHATLSTANLSDAVLTEANFTSANLDAASLSDAEASSATFRDASLVGALFADARLDDACFDGARAASVELSGASLERSSFLGALLDDARLYDCQARGARFDGASALRLRADEAELGDASFREVFLNDASFTGAKLERARFHKANLTGAVMNDARLGGARLVESVARRARFRNASLARAFAARCDLMEADFEGADLSGADLRGANLYAAETWNAKLEGAQLDQAIVAGSKLAR